MGDVVIRFGGAGDADAVLEFWKVAAEGTDRHDSVDAYLALVERDPEAVLIAEVDGRVVGTVIAGWDGWRAHLYRLAAHPGFRRQGIGRMLIERAERRFAGFGAFRADAMVLRDNVPAHRVWVAEGYRSQEHWARWVKMLE